MCGIAGILKQGNPQRFEGSLNAMVEAQGHRGPDSQGCHLLSFGKWSICLGHTRLAVIDLSPKAHQPMIDSETGNCIVYNGEVYNYRNLREELNASQSESWLSESDTEVLLRNYRRLGVDFLKTLRGMFAFALWDARKKVLLLARDPFGIKPLYYYQDGDTLIFASEIRALLASGKVPRMLSHEGLLSYLKYGSVEAPDTIVEGVRSILPGHYMTVEPNDYSLKVRERYYSPDPSCAEQSLFVADYDDAKERLRELLEESVRAHLVSDVPLGVFLSGGIDSSAVLGLMSRVIGEPPKTFSVVFAEREFSEASYSRLVANKFSTDHQEIPVSEADMLRMLPDSLEAMDQPTMDGINTYVISRVVKEAGVTVALSGLGGDELFAGYPSFSRAKRLRAFMKIPHFLRKATALLGRLAFNDSVQRRKLWTLVESDCSPWSVYSTSRQLFAPDEIVSLMRDDEFIPTVFKAVAESEDDPINAVSLYELRGYMTNTLLRDTDFMSMAHALEVRVPFVDSTLVSFVLSLPGEWKLDGHRPKCLLLDAMGDLLPEDISRRPKMGFSLPFERWMRSALKPELDGALLHGKDFTRLGISPEFVRKVWQEFKKNPQKERWSRPWSLYVLKEWCDLNSVHLETGIDHVV